MGDRWKLADRLELHEVADIRAVDVARWPIFTTPYISGIEVTQSIQYYKSSKHLTDANDRAPDNALGLAAYKPAWVRVYVRSGFFNDGAVVTGKIVVERQQSVFPIFWDLVGEYTPRAPGTVTSHQSVHYATERGSIAATLNFIIPAEMVYSSMRVRAIIWPQGGSDAAPADTEEVTFSARLWQTLRVRGILISYNGPNASGTVPNMNLAAPTVADLQDTCGNTLTVYPVESTGVYSSGGTIPWSTPLTGLATNPGGCSQQWLDLNADVADAKANDGNRPDVLYVGLLPNGVPIANVGGCNSSGVSAVPDGQEWTMAHELGHACGLAHGPCGTPGDAGYPAYEPYDPANTPTASLGEYGLDINNGTIHPPAQKDFMSYCSPPWISLYHYERLYNNDFLDPRWISPRKPHIPDLYDPWLWPWEYIPDPPPWELPSHFVKVQVLPVISIIGVVDLTGELRVSSVMRVPAYGKINDAFPTDMVAELVGANGEVVAQAAVMQTHAHGCGCGGHGDSHDHGGHGSPKTGYAFQALLPDVEPGSALRIVRVGGHEDREEIWSRHPAAEPPRIRGVSVKVSKDSGVIRWEGRACEGEELKFSVQFSKDGGRSWNGLASGLREAGYKFPLETMPSGEVVFRVLAHDGFYTVTADSQPVRLPPRPPAVSILHPQDGRVLQAGTSIRLFAAVSTHVGAINPRLELRWQLDGKEVGEGPEVWLDGLKPGRYTCRVTATDDGGRAQATAAFTVESEQRDVRPRATSS